MCLPTHFSVFPLLDYLCTYPIFRPTSRSQQAPCSFSPSTCVLSFFVTSPFFNYLPSFSILFVLWKNRLLRLPIKPSATTLGVPHQRILLKSVLDAGTNPAVETLSLVCEYLLFYLYQSILCTLLLCTQGSPDTVLQNVKKKIGKNTNPGVKR